MRPPFVINKLGKIQKNIGYFDNLVDRMRQEIQKMEDERIFEILDNIAKTGF